MYDWCALVYMIVAGIMALVFVYTKINIQHQNPGWQYIHSKWSSMNWNVYYFGVLQYGPSLLLTLVYRRTIKMHGWSKWWQNRKQEKETAAAVTVQAPYPTYEVNSMA